MEEDQWASQVAQTTIMSLTAKQAHVLAVYEESVLNHVRKIMYLGQIQTKTLQYQITRWQIIKLYKNNRITMLLKIQVYLLVSQVAQIIRI